MKKKIVGIVILMLVTTMVVSGANSNQKKSDMQMIPSQPDSNIPGLNWGVDQKQTDISGYGMTLIPYFSYAQSFTPTKDKLTAVSLGLFKAYNPPISIQITVSIRDNLTGSDLAIKTIDSSIITSNKPRWVLFDFEDISISPGSKYFIVCSGNGGNDTNAYCWGFTTERDKYNNGEAWGKDNQTSDWYKFMGNGLEPDDFCFKTYYKKPISSNENLINLIFLSKLERFPTAFSVFRHQMRF